MLKLYVLLYFLNRETDITTEVIDALSDVWDKELSVVDVEAMEIEDVKCPLLRVIVCMWMFVYYFKTAFRCDAHTTKLSDYSAESACVLCVVLPHQLFFP